MTQPKSGRTISIAYQLIGKALAVGGEWVVDRDHHPGMRGMAELESAVLMAVKQSNLQVEVKADPLTKVVAVRTVFRF